MVLPGHALANNWAGNRSAAASAPGSTRRAPTTGPATSTPPPARRPVRQAHRRLVRMGAYPGNQPRDVFVMLRKRDARAIKGRDGQKPWPGAARRLTVIHARNIAALVARDVTGGVTNGKCPRNPSVGNIDRCMQVGGAAGARQQARGGNPGP